MAKAKKTEGKKGNETLEVSAKGHDIFNRIVILKGTTVTVHDQVTNCNTEGEAIEAYAEALKKTVW